MNASLIFHWDQLVRRAPEAPALIEAATGRVWTRAALDAEADAWLAAHAGSHELKHRRVTFALPNGAHWLTVFLALLRARAIPVPLDPTEPETNQRTLAISAPASFALLDGQLTQPVCHLLSDKPAVRTGLVKLTSGSTGRPRALAFTDAQMLADGHQVCATMGITPEDLNFAVIPFGHSYGLGNLIVPLLAQGTPILCSSAPLPHALAADIARWQPTVFPAVPALLRALAESNLPPDALAPLRTVISAGAPLPATTAQAFFKKFSLRPHSFYGSSETGGITYDRTGEATLTGRSVGTTLEGVSLSPAHGQRIRVTSPAVHGRGSFIPADRATINDHGELVLLGRAGRLVKIAGRRLDLGDLERSLRALPGLRDAYATVHPHNPEDLAAVLATTLDLAAARTLLRRELAAWKVPRRLVVVPEFPLTARGKPDVAALGRLIAR